MTRLALTAFDGIKRHTGIGITPFISVKTIKKMVET